MSGFEPEYGIPYHVNQIKAIYIIEYRNFISIQIYKLCIVNNNQSHASSPT